jgi:Glycosyltransferase like family
MYQEAYPVISIICIYNDERAFSCMLKESVQRQISPNELIPVDNTGGTFKSAPEALNYAAGQSHGDYLMFVHQDVILTDKEWLGKTERILNDIPDIGVAGCAGIDDSGKKQGFIKDRYHYWGTPLTASKEVQTLDESVLIIPRKVFESIQFDEENFKGWHCYGADYCLTVSSRGLRNYVIPNQIYHNSPNLNIADLLKEQRILFGKHNAGYKYIYTTSGTLSRIGLTVGPMIDIIRRFYVYLFPQFFSYVGGILRRELSGCKSVLDIGWQRNFPIQSITRGLARIDLHNFDASTPDWRGLGESKFDAVIALDVLDHFPKEDGHNLLKRLENLARRKLILLCPNGDLYKSDSYLSELQKSTWTASELKNLGFKVQGVNGWRVLRGYDGEIKFGPNLFWQLVSDLSQKLFYFCPKYSFELFCAKELERGGGNGRLA